MPAIVAWPAIGVDRHYNRFGQLTSEFQLHSEAEFHHREKLHVDYGYDVGAVSGNMVAHPPRRTVLGYPRGGILALNPSYDRSNRIREVRLRSGTALGNPRYDKNGNMIRIPHTADAGGPLDCDYDGWDRLVRVRRGDWVLAEYEYDGLGRRIIKRLLHPLGVIPVETRHFIIRTRGRCSRNASGTA